MNKWIVEAKAFEYDKHYSDCKKSNQPFIKARINRQTGNYLVFLDLATCSYGLNTSRQEKLKKLFESEAKYAKQYSMDEKYCTFDGISTSRLESFLSSIYEITQL